MAISSNLFSLMLMAAFLKPVNMENTGKIMVTVLGLENDNGKLILKVFNNPDGFPREDEKAYKILSYDIKNKTCSAAINLPVGEYAIAASHDIKGNGKVDTNFLGVPKEPLGMSNYPKAAMPNYEKAKYMVIENETISLTIQVNKIF